ncbi:MAG: LysE family translocator [Thermomicrobiales bacterium]|nr:LysE family translocator [Thermomicrobiales bacterium]
MSWQFLITALVIVATPGTGAIYCIMTGTRHGMRSSILAAAACTLGILPHLLAAITGLAAVLHTSALAFQSIKYAGVLYLLYMAWSMWRDHGEMVPTAVSSPQRPTAILRRGIIINLLNPKLTIFFFAFLPGFVHPGALPETAQMIYLSGIFMALTFVVFALYGMLAGRLQDRLLVHPSTTKKMNRGFALSFVAMGSLLALEKQ